MSIDVDAEQLIPFIDATRAFPGRSVCLQTLHRWRLRGVRGVKLETCLVGNFRFTSREAIARFITAQNDGDSGGSNAAKSSPGKPSPSQRAREKATAHREAQELVGVR